MGLGNGDLVVVNKVRKVKVLCVSWLFFTRGLMLVFVFIRCKLVYVLLKQETLSLMTYLSSCIQS